MKNPWLGDRRGYLTDWITQQWVRLTGRRIDVAQSAWLLGPGGSVKGIREDYFERLAGKGKYRVRSNAPETGLLAGFSALHSDKFDTTKVAPAITRFYEATSGYQFDVWSEWSGVFRPFGWLLRVIFSRRLQQMNVPLSPLETCHGVTSEIITFADRETGAHLFTGWLRKNRATRDVIYAGLYSFARPPAFNGPCVKVVFPLPNGHATVLLRPELLPDGSVKLHSDGNGFGDAGFYFVVQESEDRAWARYVRTMKETLHVFLSPEGDLHADHRLRIWGIPFLRLRYRMMGPKPAGWATEPAPKPAS